ncbi:ZinT/AdcA family metal-binding protein [Peptoniphilus equinus]|uniref:ZinT/AdcA family metal-binding protein n=1 Tax=Peptoniphilus equinus TaxID=3016343 RepID=A0ABY7QT82_9FIRM|nr:ZinT/AdcA family metal-binding protein [Peptoniphilus equinus]WBW49358.1 ZinT/AdcA family metal-binding protein [Peptoniphilus equinus]
MNNRLKRSLKTLGLCIAVMAALTACAQEEKQADAITTNSSNAAVGENAMNAPQVALEDIDAVSLSEWEDIHPVWSSITTFYDRDYLVKAADEKAAAEGKQGSELLAEHEAGAHIEVASIEFSGDTITLKDKAGQVIASGVYKYVKTIGKGKEHGEFAVFEAQGDVPESYKVLALMAPHGGEGDITHFHIRHGAGVDDPALEDENWWPVFVDPDSTEEQVIHEIVG